MNTPLRVGTFVAVLLAHTPAFANQTLPVQVSENQGFVDLDLPITDVVNRNDVIGIVVRGTLDGSVVGFEVDFPTGDNSKGALGGPLSLGTARIRSLGPESDRFVVRLSQHYHVSPSATAMIARVDVSAVGLGDGARGRKEMKFFFFDNGPEDRYAEVYVNIDFDRHILEFHEKDSDYRKPLIQALTRAP